MVKERKALKRRAKMYGVLSDPLTRARKEISFLLDEDVDKIKERYIRVLAKRTNEPNK